MLYLGSMLYLSSCVSFQLLNQIKTRPKQRLAKLFSQYGIVKQSLLRREQEVGTPQPLFPRECKRKTRLKSRSKQTTRICNRYLRNWTGPPELISPLSAFCTSHAHAQEQPSQCPDSIASSPPFAVHRIHRALSQHPLTEIRGAPAATA